jgi:hypothetical protein
MSPEDDPRYDVRVWAVHCRKEGLRDLADLTPRALSALDRMFLARGGSYARLAQGASYETRLAGKLASCYVRWLSDQEVAP